MSEAPLHFHAHPLRYRLHVACRGYQLMQQLAGASKEMRTPWLRGLPFTAPRENTNKYELCSSQTLGPLPRRGDCDIVAFLHGHGGS
jgi:hypothetical protein